MTVADESVRALGKALRLKLRTDDDVPGAMQAALIGLANLPEPTEACPRSEAKVQVMEQANGHERQAEEACVAG